ncbi:phage tail spike protein [Clostridium perfringens]|uniref:phage tail spike protein n=1 Tax=Clostridium perfringens TaxID=1502 RepID=UPI0022468C5D|nr:phage tail spike protein [Clostridium perfringens]MCX0411803.1 phage tail protein [Clostridium perfringens]
MIELRDKDKNRVAGLVDYENLCIESVLESGDKTLSFYYPKKGKYYDEIVEEAYIRTKKDEFVVKARELDEDYTKFECSLNLEELEGNIFDRFESVEQTITSALNLAVVGTGWTVKDNTLKKRRTVRCTNKSSLEIVRESKKIYRVDIVFNTLVKQIEVYEHLGEDKGTYFIDSLNLIALQVQSDSRQYATRIIAEGKDGLSFSDINNGKNYVENYQYSNKIKTIYWKDERYSVKESLLEDARAKLEELSKPFRSYSASVLNLAELNPRYSSILDFKLGDVINLISKKNKIKDKQRIVKTIEWPQDHTKDSVELANATLKFEDIQQENQETTDTVNNITTDNGTVDGSTIDSITTKQIEDFEANVIKVAKLKAILAEIENLHVNKADIQNLNAVIARIGTLEATKASITELNAIHAIIQQIKAGKADITDLNAAVAKVGILENKTAVLENALAGNLTADNFKTNAITAGSAVIAEGAIGSSQISSLSVNKLEAGDITTSKHRIVSADGTVEIVGNQILINRNNINRVILGEYRKLDNTTEYGLLIRGKDGRTVMFDSDGVHNAGITDGAIDNNKVADNANISGNKLDINSVIREVNANGTETIKGTKVIVGDRTLDVELSTQKNTITEHGKELSSQKATIQALDSAIKLKVDSQTFTQSTQTINNNITRAKEEAINAIEIGGKNLLIGTSNDYKEITVGQWNGAITNMVHCSTYGLKVGDKFTVSATIKPINKTGLKLRVDFYSNTTGGGKTPYISNVIVRKGEEKRDSLTLTVPKDKEYIVIYLQNYLTDTETTSTLEQYKEAKLEKGTKATDWTPAPEDLKKYSDDVAKAKADLAQANAIANADGKITTEEQKRIQQAQENLNTAISKADKAKQDAISEANRVAELKKQEAINSANSHADSKANEALNNAKAFVNAEITTVKSHLNKATAEINVLKEKIESKVSQSDIDKSIQEIKIGGINLLRNSDYSKYSKYENIGWDESLNGSLRPYLWSDYNSGVSNPSEGYHAHLNITKFSYPVMEFNCVSTSRWLGSSQYFSPGIIKPNCEYTFSIYLYGDSDTSECQAGLYYFKNGSDRQNFYSGLNKFDIKKGEWNRYEFTFKTSDDLDVSKSSSFYIYGYYKIGKFYCTKSKLEEGNFATGYSKAPEDMDQLIIDNIKTVTDKISTVESKFTQENNSIKASVQDLNSTTQSITTNVSNINRDLTSKINSNLDAAKSFATDIAIAKANLAKEQAIANADGKITEEERKRIAEAKKNLDTAIARADKAKQDAINTASSDATNKANNALNSAKAYTNAEITTINSKVHNVESNLNILSDRINSKVSQSDVEKSIREVVFNGRNLVRNSDLRNDLSFFNINNNSGHGSIEIVNFQGRKCLKFTNISEYSVSKYLSFIAKGFKINNNVSIGVDVYAIDGEGLCFDTSHNLGVEYINIDFTEKNKWIRLNKTSSKKTTKDGDINFALYGKGKTPVNCYITLFKVEEGNKSTGWTPAPEDESKVILDNIKVVDSKISDVSSSVTQLRDSVTTQINSINSKTHSIETALGGKASKQEITEVNNRVTTIKASLDGITQRVSATESKTQTLESNLNGKASKQEVNNVSSKVVSLETNLNGITNRVSNTESRINTLDGKVASAVTNQQFTEFKQSNDKFKFTVEQRSSVSNILPNGSFFGGDRGWLHDGVEFWYGAYSGYGFKGRMTGAIKNRTSYNNPERFLQTHKAYKVKKNTTYTISFHYACEMNIHSMEAYVVLSDTEHGDYAQPIRILEKPGGTQSDPNNEIPFTYKFNTGNHEWVWLRFDHNGMKPGTNLDQYCWLYVSEIGIYEGDVGAVKWTPKGGEVYSANYQMDGLGFKGTFEDGTYASLGRDGLEWYNAGTGHAYHALTYVTSFDIPVGNPGKAYIKLPAEFTKRRSSLKWTVALRGYYYNTTGNFFPFHVHCTGARDYIENGLVVCEVQGLCKIQNGSNSGDVQFRPLTAMLIAIA